MTFRQPLIHRWRQQNPVWRSTCRKLLIPLTAPGIPSFQSYHIMRHLPPKSDRLLANDLIPIEHVLQRSYAKHNVHRRVVDRAKVPPPDRHGDRCDRDTARCAPFRHATSTILGEMSTPINCEKVEAKLAR